MDILGITIWREARSEGYDGMRAVYWVIHNRAFSGRPLWPNDREEVCLQPFQFSCWNPLDPQRNLYPESTDESYQTAVNSILIPGVDLTLGSTSYFDSSIKPPIWATDKTFKVKIGKLEFHRI